MYMYKWNHYYQIIKTYVISVALFKFIKYINNNNFNVIL